MGICKGLLRFICKFFQSLEAIFIVIFKNLRIRRRRYVALLLEMTTPIFTTCLIIIANNRKSLLRPETTTDFVTSAEELEANRTLVGFYDLGGHYAERQLLEYSLCGRPTDMVPDVPNGKVICRIGFVADDATTEAIFWDNLNDKNTSEALKQFFQRDGKDIDPMQLKFIRFDSEESMYHCLNKGYSGLDRDSWLDCWDENVGSDYDLDQLEKFENPVLSFRGAVIFETSIDATEIRYKIRLMETYYTSLRHVMKTDRTHPSIYDRRSYGLSYIQTGFLATQLTIDRMIIKYLIKTRGMTPEPVDVDAKFPDCPCKVVMHEIPHRQSDNFNYPDDPLGLSHDYDIDHEVEDVDHHDQDFDSSLFVEDSLNYKIDRENQVSKQSLVVATVIVLSFSFLLPSELRRVASEKENGLTILLLVTGMTHRMQWIGNLMAVCISYLVTITIVVILLTYPFDKDQGAVFIHASPTILWVLIFLYVMALASAGYFTVVFFDRPMTAITGSFLFWLAPYIGTLYHVDYYYDVSPEVTFVFCFHPCVAFHMSLRLLMRFERHKIHTHIFSMTRYIPTDPLRIIVIVAVLILDTVVYMVLAVYLDRILKSRYGVNKPWYYIFKLSEYRSQKDKVAPAEMTYKETSTQPGFERGHHENVEPSIFTTNLTKKYGSKTALENLNIQLYHGEIFALLGHNGAGKSTILNLFSGFTPATSGTARIYGYDITTHMVQIQEFSGMCPQYNRLYEDLTPYEHLLIFGKLRGLKGHDAEEEALELLEKLRIHEMAHWSTRKLSTGDKRKLCLAIALVGNPKLLILDEPTAGLDYFSRRAVWDILLKIRGNHTIIFTTHFMDEAELLGDRIGILASGKMHVCGSHAFLRQHFGLGYSLRIRMDPSLKPDPEKILKVVQATMPKAVLSTLPIAPYPDRLCTCNLPVEGYSSAVMSKLFTDLAQQKESLGVIGFTVSNATVDEVFLELSRQLDAAAIEADRVALTIVNDESQEEHREEEAQRMFEIKKKVMASWIQYWILLKKRMLYSWRNKTVLFFQISLPCLIYMSSYYRMSTHVFLDGRSGPPLELKVDIYKDGETLYYATEDSFIKPDILKAVIGSSGRLAKNSDISGDFINTDYYTLRHKRFVGISVNSGSKGQMAIHFSPYVLHSAPIAMTLYSNALVKHMYPDKSIVTINHPLQHPYFTGPEYDEDPYAPEIGSLLANLAAAIIVSFCVMYPLDERLTYVKHLQLMAGVSSGVYWIAIFTWDNILFVIQCALVYIFTLIYPPLHHLILQGEGPPNIGCVVQTLVYLFCGLMMVYLVSKFAYSKSGAFALLLSNALLFGIIVPFFIYGVDSSDTAVRGDFTWLIQIIPFYAVTSAHRKYLITLLGNGRCNHFTELGHKEYCSTNHPRGIKKVTCCINCRDIPGAEKARCYNRNQYVETPFDDHDDNKLHFNDIEEFWDHIYESPETRSIFSEIIFLGFMGLILSFLVVFLDSNYWSYILSCIHGERGRAFQTSVDDEDVLDEMDRVERMVFRKETNGEGLIAHNICKSYGSYPAVHNISFTIHPGDSFGIIGVNGAGKSTLFRVLTGTLPQTYGNVYSQHCSMTSKRTVLMRKMGYTPQHGGAVFEHLTSLETLVVFGRLRGLGSKEAQKESNSLLEKLGLEQFKNTPTRLLSGGIKRRLSMASAIIAKPPVLLFDEPTSAADPASRRKVWEIMKEVRRLGHTLLLSSHFIIECQQFSQRIVVMVDGKFQCIGTPANLLKKYGSGYKLMVKLIPGHHAENHSYVDSLSDSIVKIFNPCTLRDRRRNVIQYVIHDASFTWDFLFQMMEHTKLRYNDLVEDYAFSNTTMEEVFLSFVKLQHCGRIPEAPAPGCCTNFCI